MTGTLHGDSASPQGQTLDTGAGTAGFSVDDDAIDPDTMPLHGFTSGGNY